MLYNNNFLYGMILNFIIIIVEFLIFLFVDFIW